MNGFLLKNHSIEAACLADVLNFCMMQIHCRTRITRALIRLCGCTDWAAPLLLAIITVRFYRATSQLFFVHNDRHRALSCHTTVIFIIFYNTRDNYFLTRDCSSRKELTSDRPARMMILARMLKLCMKQIFAGRDHKGAEITRALIGLCEYSDSDVRIPHNKYNQRVLYLTTKET